MEDDPINKIGLNKDEKILYEFILANRGFNKLQIVEKTKVNKNTAQKYLDTLCDYDLIEFVELKQGEKSYFSRLKYVPPFSESHLKIKNDFSIRKKLIKNCLSSLSNYSKKDIIFIYSKCVEWVFSFQKIIKFTIYSNTQKKPMKQWLELEKELEEFLQEITSKLPDFLYSSVLANITKLDNEILQDLEKFNQKSLE